MHSFIQSHFLVPMVHVSLENEGIVRARIHKTVILVAMIGYVSRSLVRCSPDDISKDEAGETCFVNL